MTRYVLFALLSVLCVSASLGSEIEDFSFSGGGGNVSIGTINQSITDANTFGGQTWMRLTSSSGLGQWIVLEANSTNNPSLVNFGTNAKDVGAVGMRWSGVADSFDDFSPTGIPPTSLADSGASDHFLLDLRLNDVPSTVSVTVYSSAGSATASFDLPGGHTDGSVVKTFGLPFSAFPGVDFDAVTAIDLGATTQEISPGLRYKGWDLVVDNVRTGPAPDPVPPTGFVPNAHPAAHALPMTFLSIDQFLDSNNSGMGPGGISGLGADRLGGAVTYEFDSQGPFDPFFSFFVGNEQLSDDNVLLAAHGTVDVAWIAAYDGDTDFSFTTFGLVKNPVDLTGAGMFDSIWIGVLHSDVPASMMIEVHSDFGVLSSTVIVDLPLWNFNGTTLVIPFDSFTGAADFTDVTAMRFTTLSEAEGLDLEIDYMITAAIPCSASSDGDADGDRDLRDVAGLQACFTGTGSFAISGACSTFNANCDADVDLPDFAALLPLTGP